MVVICFWLYWTDCNSSCLRIMVFRKSFLLFNSKKLALFPLSLWLPAGRNLLTFFPIFFLPPSLNLNRGLSSDHCGVGGRQGLETQQGSGCGSHHLNPSLPRSVPGSSADPGGAQEAGGPVPHLFQPRFGPEHGPRRAFCECCFLLCGGWRGRGWGLDEAPPTAQAPPSRSDSEASRWGWWVSRGLPGLCP